MQMNLEKIGAYLRVSEITETNNAYLFDVQGLDAKIYFAKVPKNLDASSSAARQFSSVARHLKKINSEFINKVIDSGDESSAGCYFMILEKLEKSQTLEQFVNSENEVAGSYLKYILQVWYNCTEALDLAASKNIFHKDLHPKNILISGERKPVIIDFGISLLEHTISKRPTENEYTTHFSAPEYMRKEESALQSRTDFYSLSLCVLYALLGHPLFYENENNETRLQNVVNLYKPYISEGGLKLLQDVFRKSFDSDPNKRFYRYSELRDSINNLFEVINHTPEKPFAMHFDSGSNPNEFIREINAEGVFVAVNELKHHIHKNVIAKFASTNFLVNISFFSNRGNCLEIRGLKKIDSLEANEQKNHNWVLTNGLKLSGINFVIREPAETDGDNFYDVFNLLEKLFIDKRDTTRSSLQRQPREILQTYKTLLQEEINYLRNDAFKVRYTDFEVNSSNEPAFKIVVDDKVNIERINNFLKRSQASFRKGTEISLNASEDDQGIKSKQGVGFSTRFDSRANKLIVKDFPVSKKDEVPVKGFLIEDTTFLEIQYKRQLNAIKNYENDNITNSELRKYLFQPENLKKLADEAGELIADLQIISTEKNGSLVQFQDAQKFAILKSLYRPPITLIQGPPGTGKTTVITEIIRQILSKDKQAKILITSQTNLAVDNVLYKMVNVDNVSFIRLGRNIDDAVIDSHSFDKKLNLWARKTKGNCERNFVEQKRKALSTEKSLSPFLNLILQEINKKQSWEITKKYLKQILSGHFAKGFESLIKFIGNKQLFEGELSKYLGEGHVFLNKLELLKRKWISILSNIEDKDELKSKYISSINIIGATANHIAAGMYRDFKFEFDYVIMDEAAKATPAETLVPINMAHNLILVGDHEQLPPLVTATEAVKKQVEAKLNNEGETVDFDKIYYDQPSLFQIMYDGSPEEYKEMLDLQFRMPKQIGDIISNLVYNNKLKSNEKSGKPHNIKLKATTSMFMCDINKYPDRFHKVDPVSRSSYSPVSAKTITEILTKIDNIPNIFLETENDKPYDVGVITGYGKQAEYLSNEIENAYFKNLKLNKNLTIATVDSFQGSEKDIVIYDIVRSAKAKENSGLGFLEMPNRINVALTRVKRLLIIVGDAGYILNVAPSLNWINNNRDKQLLLKEFVSKLHKDGFIYNTLNEIFYE
jgi:superfamily I DNA and/or RNA helicase